MRRASVAKTFDRFSAALAAALGATFLGLGLSLPATAQQATGATASPGKLETVDRRGTEASPSAFDRFAAAAARNGEVDAIVGLRTVFTPEGLLRASEVAAQRNGIAGARAAIVTALRGTGFTVTRTFRSIPYVAVRLSPRAVDALERSSLAASLHANVASDLQLSQSGIYVEATEINSLAPTMGGGGTGQHVVVLDSGIDKTHPFLQRTITGPSKVVSEACYSQNADCPNGQQIDTSVGSGVHCNFSPAQAEKCGHGTHVAGIATGRGASAGQTFSGVAPNARLISMRVFHNCATPSEPDCVKSFPVDQLSALQRTYDLRTQFPIAAVNLSLGGSPVGGNCDGNPLKAHIDNLLSVGIPTVIAAGNDGSNGGVSEPGCISTAVTVSSTTDKDVVSCFSNMSGVVDLMAPGGAGEACDDTGTDILSSVPGNAYGSKQGTSMAAPHVAGAFAVLRNIDAVNSVGTLLFHLQTTGKPITDPFAHVTIPRMRLLATATRFKDSGFTTANSFTYPGGDIISNGVGLASGRYGASTAGGFQIAGLPAGASVQNAYLYWMTLGGPDNMITFAPPGGSSFEGGDCVRLQPPASLELRCFGQLVGASADPGWNINQLGPNRVYRATVPVANIPGNGTYAVKGVGKKENGSEGQGASLVVIYSQPGSPKTGRVVVRHGAMTAPVFGSMSHTFTGLSVPVTPSQVKLHVGIGDGEPSRTEDPMLFAGSSVTDPNAFFGADGQVWDDASIPLSPTLLPAGITDRTNSIQMGTEHLAWGYAALAYQYP